MKDPICCPLQVDTFLADSKVKLIGIEKPRKTTAEKKELAKSMEESLDYPILWNDFAEEISIDEKMERLNKYLDSLYKQEEVLVNEGNREALEKLERELKFFLSEKKQLEWEYQRNLSSILEEALKIPYPKDFWENKRKALEEQRECILSQKENLEEKRVGR